jgi:hypothetical protein
LEDWFDPTRSWLSQDLATLDLDEPATLNRFRNDFMAAQSSRRYLAAYEETHPLVSVCITTSDRAEILAERALTSDSPQMRGGKPGNP